MKEAKLLYVLASSHSGSTLTAILLGSHPKTCTVGELKLNSLGDPNRYLCSCKSPILKCRFWASIKERMAHNGEKFTLSDPQMDFSFGTSEWVRRVERPLYRGRFFEAARYAILSTKKGWQSHIQKVNKRNSILVKSLLEETDSEIVVDSSKVGSRLRFLLDNESLDVFVVRVIRDGRAVALTYMNPESFADASDPALRGGGMGVSRDGEILTMQEAAREWKRSNEEAESILKLVRRDRQIQIRYESLCDNPLETMNNVFDLLSLPRLTIIPDFRRRNPHVLGNGMRFDQSTKIYRDDRWRSVLKEDDLLTFERIAGKLNRRLGYE